MTSDAGVLVTREVIEKTGLIPYLTERLHDPRDPCRIKHSLAVCHECSTEVLFFYRAEV